MCRKKKAEARKTPSDKHHTHNLIADSGTETDNYRQGESSNTEHSDTVVSMYEIFHCKVRKEKLFIINRIE